MSSENKRVGENIREFRKERRYTQQDIANLVGVTKQTICKIEKTGSTNPKTLARIADVLHVDVHKFYEPIPKSNTESSCPDFFTDEDIKLFIFECRPVLKKINDTIVKNMRDKVTEKLNADKSKIKSVLSRDEFQSETYTHDEVAKACFLFYAEIYSDITGIFQNNEIEAVSERLE